MNYVFNTTNDMMIKALIECDKKRISVRTIEEIDYILTQEEKEMTRKEGWSFKVYLVNGKTKIKVAHRECCLPFWTTKNEVKFLDKED